MTTDPMTDPEPVHTEPVQTEWVFTFGWDHRHPITGAPLMDRYLVLTGTYEATRAEMVRRFGARWSCQYASREAAGVDRFKLRELT